VGSCCRRRRKRSGLEGEGACERERRRTGKKRGERREEERERRSSSQTFVSRDDATLVSPLASSKMNADAAQRYAFRATALREVGLDGCRRSALASLRARTVVKVRE